MRILFWNQSYLPRLGGLESFTGRLAAELLKSGHEPVVITHRHSSSEADEETIEGVSVHRFDFAEALNTRGDPAKAIRGLRDMTRAVAARKQRIRPDIVHVNFTDGSPIFHLRTRASWPCPTILTFHANLGSSLGRAGTGRALLDSAARVTAVCRFAAEDLAAKAGVPPDRIEVVAPGVTPFELRPHKAPGEGRFSLLFIGRLVAGKGADVAIRAMREVDRRVTLAIVGDGPERAPLGRLVAELDLDDRVMFLGGLDARQAPLPIDALALIVPSDGELFGTVAAEAALTGLPVIASSIGGLPEVVEHGVTGLLVPPGDPAAIAEAVHILVENPARARAMGHAGREKALRLYTVERMFESYLRIYGECQEGLSD